MKDVMIVVTGGTIDKVHDPYTEGLSFAKDEATQIPEILNQSRCYFAKVHRLMLKDSLYFDDSDREAIAQVIEKSSGVSIVVTHGTGTMGESARWLEGRAKGKTIVFTGSMRPHSLGSSDGPFNLGGAIIASQILSEGVYGVMNGRVFEAENLNKNSEQGRFDV